MKKHYLVYQITNLVNQKIYIGIHGTDDLEDGYMGSGSRLQRAIKKHGIKNFQKNILFEYDNPDEMIAKERELVDRKFIARKDVYNIKLGGEGWLTFDSIVVKDNDGNRFRVHKTDDRWLNGELKGIQFGNRYELSEEYKGLILAIDSDKNVYRIKSDDFRLTSGELISFWLGRKHKEESKKKIGEANSILQKGERNSQFGTCWIHNEVESKKIKKEELDSFLSKGWIKGRKIKF